VDRWATGYRPGAAVPTDGIAALLTRPFREQPSLRRWLFALGGRGVASAAAVALSAQFRPRSVFGARQEVSTIRSELRLFFPRAVATSVQNNERLCIGSTSSPGFSHWKAVSSARKTPRPLKIMIVSLAQRKLTGLKPVLRRKNASDLDQGFARDGGQCG